MSRLSSLLVSLLLVSSASAFLSPCSSSSSTKKSRATAFVLQSTQIRRDFYEVLGVNADAEVSEIKQAYRFLARRYHPDMNKEYDTTEKFKEINRAYQALLTLHAERHPQNGIRQVFDKFQGVSLQSNNFSFSGQSVHKPGRAPTRTTLQSHASVQMARDFGRDFPKQPSETSLRQTSTDAKLELPDGHRCYFDPYLGHSQDRMSY